MRKLDVRHYLRIYQLRERMQDEGITNPTEEIKKFTKELVVKLINLPMDEEVVIVNNSFFDSKGNLIITIPVSEEEI